jgi:hypothetical protein
VIARIGAVATTVARRRARHSLLDCGAGVDRYTVRGKDPVDCELDVSGS